MWATRAFWVLRYAGHENVRVLNGGLAAWRRAGGDVEGGEAVYPETSFAAELRPGMIASMTEVFPYWNANVNVDSTTPVITA